MRNVSRIEGRWEGDVVEGKESLSVYNSACRKRILSMNRPKWAMPPRRALGLRGYFIISAFSGRLSCLTFRPCPARPNSQACVSDA